MSSSANYQIDSSRGPDPKVRDFKLEKEAAIIDEDVNSEDAKSVGKDDLPPNYSKKKIQQKLSFKTPREVIVKPKKADKFEYQLVGVLIHSGSADAGHYYSYIKERNKKSPNYGKWYEFNDTTVKEFDIRNLKKECFGGQ